MRIQHKQMAGVRNKLALTTYSTQNLMFF